MGAKKEETFGSKFSSAMNKGNIESSLSNLGDGARGIVFGGYRNKPGHVFNVVNQKGNIRFLDGQTGKPAKLDGYDTLQLLITN